MRRMYIRMGNTDQPGKKDIFGMRWFLSPKSNNSNSCANWQAIANDLSLQSDSLVKVSIWLKRGVDRSCPIRQKCRMLARISHKSRRLHMQGFSQQAIVAYAC